jgi:hypothetical protein
VRLRSRVKRLERRLPPPPPEEQDEQRRWRRISHRFMRLVERALATGTDAEHVQIAAALNEFRRCAKVLLPLTINPAAHAGRSIRGICLQAVHPIVEAVNSPRLMVHGTRLTLVQQEKSLFLASLVKRLRPSPRIVGLQPHRCVELIQPAPELQPRGRNRACTRFVSGEMTPSGVG